MSEFEDHDVPVLTESGWTIVEIIERMLTLGYNTTEICQVLDITEGLMYLMLAKAKMERGELEDGIRDL